MHSLAYFKLVTNIENEIRTYWGLATMREFGAKYLNTCEDLSVVEIGGATMPYTYIDIPKKDMILQSKIFVDNIKSNTLLNLVTSLEVYFNDIISRLVYLCPHLLSENTMQWTTKDFVPELEGNFRMWFAEEVTSKLIRNKQHKDIINFISKTIKWDFSIDDKIALWDKYTYVRNCIAHNSRRTSKDLCRVWPDKYSQVGIPLKINNSDIMYAMRLALNIAKKIEEPIMDKYIKDNDAKLLCREIYVREGIDDIGILKSIIHRNLSHKAKTETIQEALSFQRKTNQQPTDEFNFDAIYQHLIISQ